MSGFNIYKLFWETATNPLIKKSSGALYDLSQKMIASDDEIESAAGEALFIIQNTLALGAALHAETHGEEEIINMRGEKYVYMNGQWERL